MLLGLDQVYYQRYNGENVIIYLNMDVVVFGTCSHVVIKMQKVDPRTEKGVRILIKESDKNKNQNFFKQFALRNKRGE